MSLDNLSIAEALWVVLTIVLLALDANLLREAERDRAAVALKDGKARLLVTGGNIRREWSRIVVQAIFLGLGIVNGLFVPRAILEAVNTGWAVTIGGFVAAQIVLIWSAYSDTTDRRRLLADARKLAAAGPLLVRTDHGSIVIESGPGEPDPLVKRSGGAVVTEPDVGQAK